jgi:hypothetical protein
MLEFRAWCSPNTSSTTSLQYARQVYEIPRTNQEHNGRCHASVCAGDVRRLCKARVNRLVTVSVRSTKFLDDSAKDGSGLTAALVHAHLVVTHRRPNVVEDDCDECRRPLRRQFKFGLLERTFTQEHLCFDVLRDDRGFSATQAMRAYKRSPGFGWIDLRINLLSKLWNLPSCLPPAERAGRPFERCYGSTRNRRRAPKSAPTSAPTSSRAFSGLRLLHGMRLLHGLRLCDCCMLFFFR